MAKKAATPTTVTLKHLAAAIAEDQELSKKKAEAILGDLVGRDHQAPQEGRAHPHRRSRHPPGAQARRPHGPQPRHRRSDPDQGQQEGRLPRRQGAEGSRLIGRVFRDFVKTWRHSGAAYTAPGMTLRPYDPTFPALQRF